VKQPKSVRPVKAWAVVESGKLQACMIFDNEFSAKDWCTTWRTRKVMEVLITPIPKKRDSG
jgi:hypothetical protein